MSLHRFPSRLSCIWLIREELGGWLVVAGSFGWLHGSYNEAMDEAVRLARSLQITIREVRPW
jgi:hypothetical protein